MELHPLLDAKLVQLNSWLLHRTYLVGNSLTLADLVVYAFVSPAVVSVLYHAIRVFHNRRVGRSVVRKIN